MQLSFCKNGSRYAGYMFMSTKCLPNAGHVDFERGKSHTKYAKQCRTILLISFRCTFTFSFCQAPIFPSSFFFFFFNSWCAAFCRHCVFSLSHALSPHHSCSLAQGLQYGTKIVLPSRVLLALSSWHFFSSSSFSLPHFSCEANESEFVFNFLVLITFTSYYCVPLLLLVMSM